MANHRTHCWYSDDPDPEVRRFCGRNGKGRRLDKDEPLVHRECEAATAELLRFQELGQLESRDLWAGLGLETSDPLPVRRRDVELLSWEAWLGPSDENGAVVHAPLSTIIGLRREAGGLQPGRTGAAQIPVEEIPDPCFESDRLDELLDGDPPEELDDDHEPWADSVDTRNRRVQELVYSGFPPERISRDEHLSVQMVREVSHEDRQVLRGFRDLFIRVMGSRYRAETIAAIFEHTITPQHVRRIQKNPVSEWELGVGTALRVMYPEPGAQDEVELVMFLIRALHGDPWGMPASARDEATTAAWASKSNSPTNISPIANLPYR